MFSRDPATWTFAAVAEWEHPLSREALVLLDLFDLEHHVNSKKKPKPHPMRPKAPTKGTSRYGNTGGRSVAEVKDILRRRFQGAI